MPQTFLFAARFSKPKGIKFCKGRTKLTQTAFSFGSIDLKLALYDMLKKIRQHPIQKHLSDLLRGDVRLSCTRKLMCKHFNSKTDLCIPNIDQNCFQKFKSNKYVV